MKKLLVPLVAFLMVAGVAQAQVEVQVQPGKGVKIQAQPNVQVQPAQPNTQAPQAWRAKQILGAKVQLSGNTMAGTVEDIVFTDDGQLEYLLVSQNGKIVTVPWEAAKFNVAQQTATIELTQQQYQAIPTYTVETYPQFFAPQYREQVYKTYNLRPGQIRRLERRGQLP